MVGLREEDMFSTIWKSVQNRWAWLAINLVTALIASRVIGIFEGSIEKSCCSCCFDANSSWYWRKFW